MLRTAYPLLLLLFYLSESIYLNKRKRGMQKNGKKLYFCD